MIRWLSDHWPELLGVWLLVAWLGWSLCAIGKTPAPKVPDEVTERIERRRHLNAVLDAERARFHDEGAS